MKDKLATAWVFATADITGTLRTNTISRQASSSRVLATAETPLKGILFWL